METGIVNNFIFVKYKIKLQWAISEGWRVSEYASKSTQSWGLMSNKTNELFVN